MKTSHDIQIEEEPRGGKRGSSMRKSGEVSLRRRLQNRLAQRKFRMYLAPFLLALFRGLSPRLPIFSPSLLLHFNRKLCRCKSKVA